jgi:hypothetical protein
MRSVIAISLKWPVLLNLMRRHDFERTVGDALDAIEQLRRGLPAEQFSLQYLLRRVAK